MGPIRLSIWDEPGLLIEGFDQPPMVMMGHHRPEYRGVDRGRGLRQGQGPRHLRPRHPTRTQPPLIERHGRRGRAQSAHPHPQRRQVATSTRDAAIILNLLNDAWSDNWGFVPLTDAEIAYAGKKLKPIIFEDLVRIAELDGEPVAFMITIPDINELTADLNGELFPFGWAKLLWRLRKPAGAAASACR